MVAGANTFPDLARDEKFLIHLQDTVIAKIEENYQPAWILMRRD